MLVLRLMDVRDACAKAVNICPSTDTRVTDYINRAVERLLYEGRWKGTTQTFRLCINAEGCVVWPREIETIEAVSICRSATPVRSAWFEFSENGFGQICSENNCLNALIDRGETPAFDEVVGTNKKLAVYADKTESAGKYITLQFYDQYGQWVRTQFNGAWIDGERIPIGPVAGTYNYTNSVVRPGGLLRVYKDATVGVVRLYEYDTVTAALRPLAYYQPDETIPTYRRSLVPTLNNESCDQQSIVVAAKLRFIPVVNGEDWLVISHREAIRLACRAIFQEENEEWQAATVNWAQALRCLGMQLSHHQGAQRITINVQGSATFGAGGIGVI